MDHQSLISAIDAEIATLQHARTLLAKAANSGLTLGKATQRVTHRLSPEARKRIADAQRKRWAAARSQKKSAAPRTIRAKAAKKSIRPAKAARNATPTAKPEATATA
jgi:hypothetical protein